MKLVIKSEFVIPRQDVKDGDIITIKDEGEWRTLPTDPDKEVLTFVVELSNGEEKKLSMNKTSQTNLVKRWGDETANWVDKNVVVEIVKTQAFGRVLDVIYLSPTDVSNTSEEETEELGEEEIEQAGEKLPKKKVKK